MTTRPKIDDEVDNWLSGCVGTDEGTMFAGACNKEVGGVMVTLNHQSGMCKVPMDGIL